MAAFHTASRSLYNRPTRCLPCDRDQSIVSLRVPGGRVGACVRVYMCVCMCVYVCTSFVSDQVSAFAPVTR